MLRPGRLCATLGLLALLPSCTPVERTMNNPKLPTLREGYAGNPMRDGRFTGRYTSSIGKSFAPVLRWKLSRNPKAALKRQDTFALEVRPVERLPPADRDWLIWLGHASFLIHVDGRTLLTDPCLTAPPLMKRLAAVPLDIASVRLDYVLVSHGHYDHLDLKTLARLQDGATALVPLRLGPLVAAGNPCMAVQEAGWYQTFDTPGGPRITLLPAMHWNRRSLTDFNQTLWGSFLVQWRGKSLYFAGDTGYEDHFKEIAGLVGPVDYALLPIGAYDPSYIMRPSHMNPEEALRAFGDLGAGRLVPMHYGTFDLSDEPVGEPLPRLRAAAEREGAASRLDVLAVGEPLFLDR